MERLTVPGILDSDALESIGKYVVAAAQEAGLDKKKTYRLRLAVDELATNSIVHGYEEAGRAGLLDVWAEMDDQCLTIFLEDSGAPFDPTLADPPDDMNQPLEERQIGGLGIWLTVQGVDNLRYERVNDRNRVMFIMTRDAAAAQV